MRQPNTPRTAILRTCALCEFIFRSTGGPECPKCGFASYGARWVYGAKAYRFEQTQEPYIEKKVDRLRRKIAAELHG